MLATVLFTDIVGSTAKAAELGDRALARAARATTTRVSRRSWRASAGREVDTAGDGFFATFDGPARAIRCACAIARRAASSASRSEPVSTPASASCSTGRRPGSRSRIGARVAALAGPGEVLVSQTVKDLVAGSGIAFDDRGAAELKGVPGEWRLYAVAEERPSSA